MAEDYNVSGPGILLAASHITRPSQLSDATFNKWYNEVRLPDVIATGGISRANRFRNANTMATEAYLAIYHVPGVSVVKSDSFRSIPVTHEMLPGGESIHDFVSMEVRLYRLVQTDPEGEGQDVPYPVLLCAGVEPAPGRTDDYDAYMSEEHLAQFRSESGWRHSRRYKLVIHARGGSNAGWGGGDTTSWMTLYEFDEGNTLGTEVKPLESMTDWTKRIMETARKFELGVFHKI